MKKRYPQSAPGHKSHLDAKCDPQNDHIHKGILTPIILEKSRASLRWAPRMGAHQEKNIMAEKASSEPSGYASGTFQGPFGTRRFQQGKSSTFFPQNGS